MVGEVEWVCGGVECDCGGVGRALLRRRSILIGIQIFYSFLCTLKNKNKCFLQQIWHI